LRTGIDIFSIFGNSNITIPNPELPNKANCYMQNKRCPDTTEIADEMHNELGFWLSIRRLPERHVNLRKFLFMLGKNW
jgi:hypothetical protein